MDTITCDPELASAETGIIGR